MDEFKKSLLLDLLQDAITSAERGETTYGTDYETADVIITFLEMKDELVRTGKIGYEDPDAPLVVNY